MLESIIALIVVAILFTIFVIGAEESPEQRDRRK